jgi:hypothetical protein
MHRGPISARCAPPTADGVTLVRRTLAQEGFRMPQFRPFDDATAAILRGILT